MSKFAASGAPKTDNWADAESDDEDEENEVADDEAENDDDLEDEADDNGDDDEDDDEEEDEETISPQAPSSKVAAPPAPVPKEKKVDISQLSKKERQELKKKDLEDLDSLLADFVVDQPKTAAESVPSAAVEPSENEIETVNEDGSKAKKSKKKKKKAGGGEEKVEAGSKVTGEENPDSEAAVVVVADVSTVLKSKLKSKTKKAIPDPQKVAVVEALKAVSSSDAKKKKKKDKSKLGYNETSY